MDKTPHKKYIIDRNSLCPCRSGKKFKRCCYLTLNTDLKDKAYDLLHQKKYDQALIAFRVFLTQYIIWYNEHTVPFVKDRPTEAEPLLLIDIDAVYSIVCGISWCLESLKREEEIIIFLEQAADIIDDIRFKMYLTTLRAIWLTNAHQEQKAFQILKPFSTDENILKIPETDSGLRTLEIIQDFLLKDLSLSTNFLILDKLLLNKNTDPISQIKHLTQKAIIYFIYLDNKSASIFIDNAIKKINELDIEKIEKEFERLTIARAYELKSIISKEKEYFLKAIDAYQKLLPLINNQNDFLSWVYQRVGHSYFNLDNFEKSREYLELSCSCHASSDIIIDLVRVYIRLGKINLASEFLKKIEPASLEEDLKIDYWGVQADIALNNNDKKFAKEIEFNLSKLELSIPVFRELRNNMRFILLEMLTDKQEKQTLIYKLREFISRYFILQPNIWGIGININELLAPKEQKKQ